MIDRSRGGCNHARQSRASAPRIATLACAYVNARPRARSCSLCSSATATGSRASRATASRAARPAPTASPSPATAPPWSTSCRGCRSRVSRGEQGRGGGRSGRRREEWEDGGATWVRRGWSMAGAWCASRQSRWLRGRVCRRGMAVPYPPQRPANCLVASPRVVCRRAVGHPRTEVQRADGVQGREERPHVSDRGEGAAGVGAAGWAARPLGGRGAAGTFFFPPPAFVCFSVAWPAICPHWRVWGYPSVD